MVVRTYAPLRLARFPAFSDTRSAEDAVGAGNEWSARNIAQFAAFVLGLSLYLYFFVGIYIDDAFITLSYVKTLTSSGVWGMSEAVPSNAATSPLNVLLLACVTMVTRNAVLAVFLLTITLALLTFLGLRVFSRQIFRSDVFAYGATALLYSNPLLISTMGLESLLVVCLLVAVCVAFHSRRYLMLGLTVGLLVLARPDGVITAFIVAVLLLRRPVADLARYLCAMLIILCPWYLYSWTYLGSLVPDTFLIKLVERSWERYDFYNGILLYLERFPTETAVAVAMCLLLIPAVFILRKNRSTAVLTIILLGTAALQYVAYSLMRVPPYHWYYACSIASGAILGSSALLLAFRNCYWPKFVIVVVVAAGVIVSLWDARRWGEMPINSNWATVYQYRTIAKWIDDNYSGRSFQIWGELGVIQYYSTADAIDIFSDRRWILDVFMKTEARSIVDRIIQINFANVPTSVRGSAAYHLAARCEERRNVMMRWSVRSRFRRHEAYCFYRGDS